MSWQQQYLTVFTTSRGNMTKSLAKQIKGIWAASRIFQAGRSRFADKSDVRDKLRATGIGATATRVAEHTPIASYRTYFAYKTVSLTFAKFAARMGVQSVQDLRPEHAESFLRERLTSGCANNTLRTYAAALGKFDVALARAPRSMGIPETARLSPGVESVRAEYNRTAPRLDLRRRAYANPLFMVQAVQNSGHQLAARLQLVAGFRVSEVLELGRRSLRGETTDPVTGRSAGLVFVKGKGGFGRIQYVPAEDYRALSVHLDANKGGMGVNYKKYLADLHRAANDTGEVWAGTHALRHNYARSFLVEAAGVGLRTCAAMKETMERMGHHRISEVRTYTR